jgi:hypothetical protein
MNQEKQSNIQSSQSVGHQPVAHQPVISQQEESLRRSADQDFMRSLCQLEQTLLADVAPTEFASPLPTPHSCSADLEDVPNPLQTAIRHLDVKLDVKEFEVVVADIEQFMQDQGIPLDSPLANHIRTAAAAESAAESSADADAAPHTK